ncbi:DUF502 domain-containing protein [Bacillus timonensis]|nr:DUF502 domain-containing protein [Bacillus timonensis]
MKSIVKSFVNGTITIIPIILVIYVFFNVFTFLDSILGNILKPYMKENYIPGIGIIITFLLITALGWLSTQFISGKIIRMIDRLLFKIPFVKTLYSIIKDTFHSLLGEKRSFSKVVLVKLPGTNMKSIGFITSEEIETFANPLKDHVAVYIPQTFQVAGFTFIIPRDEIQILDVKPEEAMKFILSGGITSKNQEAK